jgi:CheY-like chemotaxis protein
MARIYLVDDDRNLAELTRIALVQNGHEVTIFHEAPEAIEETRKKKPDLILMDIMLTEVSGGEAVREMRKDPDLKSIPVIFLTALVSGREDTGQTGIYVDGIFYKTLGKPYEIVQLLKLVGSFENP